MIYYTEPQYKWIKKTSVWVEENNQNCTHDVQSCVVIINTVQNCAEELHMCCTITIVICIITYTVQNCG